MCRKPTKTGGFNALPEEGRDILFSYLFSTPKVKSILCFNVLYDDLRFLWDNYKRLSGRRRFFVADFICRAFLFAELFLTNVS